MAQSSPTGRSARARVALRIEIEEPPGQWLMAVRSRCLAAKLRELGVDPDEV